MKKYIYLILYTLLFNSLYSQCEYSRLTLTMFDSWGDGWNGNTFCIEDDCTTLETGSEGMDEFCVDLSTENNIVCGGGAWQSEVFWNLLDSEGTTLASGGAPYEGCVGGSCEPDIIEFYEFDDNGQIREYYLYRPGTIEDDAPLVFALHGYGGSAGGMISYAGMNEIAAEYGFAICYPQGLPDQSGNNFWNVGYAFHQDQTVDDVAFLTSLTQYLQEEYNLSLENVFSTGFSNGGDMSYMLACEASDIFKAIAPVAGCMMEDIYNNCNPEPIPVLEIHGTNDNVTLWDGDMNNNDGWGAYLSTMDGIDYWVNANDCSSSEDISVTGNTINHRYFDCNDNVEVWLYEVIGGGHDWPNYSNQEIWSFFSQFIFVQGDINSDNIINIQDLILIINMILNSEFDDIGDINSDSIIDILDVVLIVNMILND